MTFEIRRYRPTDRAGLYDLSIRTAEVGGDARDLYPDPELIGAIYSESYAVLEPELTFVLDNGSGVVGYIAGTADTAGFARRFAAEWLPTLADRFPEPTGELDTHEKVMRHRLHHPERAVIPELADYPAHLHIDLLPEYQRKGFGRRLMLTFLAAARTAGADRVYLGMDRRNTDARAFYHRMGFYQLDVPDAGDHVCLGRDTAAEAPAPLCETPR